MTNPTDEEFGKAKAGENTTQGQTGALQNSPPSPISPTSQPADLPSRNWRLVRVPSVLHALLIERSRACNKSIHAYISSLLK